ncbi:MAG: PD-(D/E)XK nuclease family protein [Sphaerobacter sp.]|nr:PD-(D/E)XK nuclease family protein [Sphaerobacter sp.]
MHRPRLVVGSLAAIEAALGEELRRWTAVDPLAPPLLLVGDGQIGVYLRRRLARLVGGHVNLPVRTPGQLALQLGEPALLDAGRAPLPAGGTRLLEEEVALGAGGYFAPVRQAPGFAQALGRLFRELREAGVEPEGFRAAVAQAEVDREKCGALAGLYAAYAARRRGFYDALDAYAVADPARLNAPAVLVYGLSQPSGVLRALLERLIEVVPVTVFLPSTVPEADRAQRDVVAWLSRLGASEERVPEPVPDREPTALDHLRAYLFRPAGGVAPDGTVRLVAAPDPTREVREAARACLAWAAEGIPFHEMAVAYRRDDPYRALIDEVFREAGIPVYLHGGRPLAEHPQGRRLLALLDLAGSPLRRAAVMEFVTETTLPPATARRYGAVEPATWDALSREAGIVEGRDQWLDRLHLLAQAKRRAALGEEQADPERIDERLRAELEAIAHLAAFIRDFAERLAARPERAAWQVHLDYLRDLATTYIDGAQPLLDLLAPLARLDALVPEVPFARFQRAVRLRLERADAGEVLGPDVVPPNGRFGRQGVMVLDVHSLRFLRVRAVALLGLAERSFPAPPRQDALLLDRERARLSAVGGWEIPLRATGADIEPLLFALAVAAADERLLLSYPRTGGDGRPQLPSHFFRAAAEALIGRRVGVEEVDALPRELYTRVPASRFGAATPAEALSAREYDRTLLALAPGQGIACLEQLHPPFARARAAWTARWRRPELTVYDGVLGAAAREAIAWRAGLRRPISPSRLETYATCPHRFFLAYVLRLEPVEEPDLLERIEALERGALIHDVLQRFLSECGEDDPPAAARREAHLARLRAIAEEECAERERRGLVGYPLLWQVDRKAILEDLVIWYDREVAERDDGLRPGAFEVRFGPRWTHDRADSPLSIDEPVPLQADGLTLRFQGRIDRVDWSPGRDRFRVVDYKTGAVPDHHRDGSLAGGRALQLPIYLLAASQVLGIPWERGEAEYFYASRRGEFKRVRFDGATLRERWEAFLDLLKGLTQGIASGDFHAVPGQEQAHCRHCDYRTVCDSRIARLAERKAGDPRATAFARLGEVT